MTTFLPRPPRLIYGLPAKIAAQYYARMQHTVLRMAARPNGVARKEIMADLGIGRPAACRLIKELGLVEACTVGRTEFFTLPQYLSEFVEIDQPISRQASRLERQIHRLTKDLRETSRQLLALHSRWYQIQYQRFLDGEQVEFQPPTFPASNDNDENIEAPTPVPGVDYIGEPSQIATPRQNLGDGNGEEEEDDDEEPFFQIKNATETFIRAPFAAAADDDTDDEILAISDGQQPRSLSPRPLAPKPKKKKIDNRPKVTKPLSFAEALQLLEDHSDSESNSESESATEIQQIEINQPPPIAAEVPSDLYQEFKQYFYGQDAACRSPAQLQVILDSYGYFEHLEEIWNILDPDWIFGDEDWGPFLAGNGQNEMNLTYHRLCRERKISLNPVR